MRTIGEYVRRCDDISVEGVNDSEATYAGKLSYSQEKSLMGEGDDDKGQVDWLFWGVGGRLEALKCGRCRDRDIRLIATAE